MKAQLLKIGGAISKNSPTILTGLGVAGLISTVVLAVKATPKAVQILENEVYNGGSGISKCDDQDTISIPLSLPVKDVIRLTWRCYLPAAIMGSVTIGCIIGANSISLRRNAAIASLYSLSEKAIKEYKAKVVEKIGKDDERKIRQDISRDRMERTPVKDNEIIITGNGETLCYDAFSGRYFKSSKDEIIRVLNKLSRDLMSDMLIPVNQVYYELDLSGIKVGDDMGWNIDDGLIIPDFGSQLTKDGIPCLVLDYEIEPSYIRID